MHSKAEAIINETNIVDVFERIYSTIISNIKNSLEQGSGFIIDSVIDQNINISKYNPLAASSYIKLPTELNHPRKGLINIQNTDKNECFKWCLAKWLYHSDHHAARFTRDATDFAKKTSQWKLETFTKLKV